MPHQIAIIPGGVTTPVLAEDNTIEDEVARSGMEAGFPNATDDAEVSVQGKAP